MDISDAETDFDEMSAREATQLLLEEDIKLYRKFIPEINNLDSKSFKNMFYGNKNYIYKVKNGLQFNLLLDKFDNFRALLEEWYEDRDSYCYMKEIWLKYISLESLKDKTELEIKNFLLSKNINYPSWPQKIKNKFIQICNNTTNTIIMKFKEIFERLPEIIQKILGMICSASEYCLQKGEKILSNYVMKYAFSILGGFMNIGVNNFSLIKGVFVDLVSKFKVPNFSFSSCINFLKNNASKYKEMAKIGFNSKFALVSYGIFSVYRLYSSLSSYHEIKNAMNKIKGFEKAVDELAKNFNKHKELIYNDLNSAKSMDIQNLNTTINNCLVLVNTDKQMITNLIREINSCLEENKNSKNKEVINLIGSIVQTGVGIAGAFLTGGLTCALYIGGALLNGTTVVLNGINIDNLKINIKELERILTKAKDLDKKIDKELGNITTILNENKEATPTYY